MNNIVSLHDAARNGDLKAIMALLKGNPGQVLSRNSDGLMVLHYAAYNGYKDVAEFVLASGADVNARTVDGYWRAATPLHMAAEGGHRDLAALLLANRADVNAQDSVGWTPLHSALNPLRRPSAKDHRDVAELLLFHGADVDARDDDGRTPLHYANANENTNAVEWLCQHGGHAVIEYFDRDIHVAAQGGHVKKVKALLKGDVPTACWSFIRHWNSKEFKVLLNGNPDLVFSRNEKGYTPLHWSARRDDVAVVQLLLANRAPVNAKDINGFRPLHIAAELGHTTVAQLLLASGAKVDARSGCGSTPLNWAAMNGQMAIAELLLINKADVNAKNINGVTPCGWVSRGRHRALEALLRQHGGHE
jgi:ankyrin repeat protein